MDSTTVAFFVGLVVAVILHEVSHGLVASWCGDDTARRAGRLTLNPIPHLDPVGSILLPALGALANAPVIGWAKPVPVNPARLRNRRRDLLLVSLAGPATNFALTVVAALAARLVLEFTEPDWRVFDDLPLTVRGPFAFALVNLFLGLFNLLPIPPLDGAAIVERMLPAEALPRWHRIRPYGFLVLFVVVFSTNIVRDGFEPFIERLAEFVFV